MPDLFIQIYPNRCKIWVSPPKGRRVARGVGGVSPNALPEKNIKPTKGFLMSLHRRHFMLLSSGFLAACSQPSTSLRQEPPFYRDLAHAHAQIDAQNAAQMISGYRRNHGLPAVSVDPRLTLIAREMAYAMASRDQVQVSLSQSPVLERLKRAGYVSLSGRSVSGQENVSAGYRSFAEAFSGWRASPSHDKVLKTNPATHMGIATAYASGSKYKVYWALILAHDGR